MEERKIGEIEKGDDVKLVYDSSLDYKGRIPVRAKTGVWRASLFVFAIEFSERLSYFGIATSLILYLTKVIHMDLKTAAKNCNYWSGVTTMMPLLGGFLADAYLGRFSAVLASSAVYLLGLILLTMSRVVPAFKPCEGDNCNDATKIHEIIFFIAIYLVSIGTGGHKPSLESFGADQFDDDHPKERRQKMSFFNWWNFGLCAGLLLGVTLIVYAQDHIGWAMTDVILSTVMGLGIVIFCIGRPVYRYRKPNGSPLTPLLQVVVAAIRKRNLAYPLHPDELYEVAKPEKMHGRLLCHTDKLKFLDKAAILEKKQGNATNDQRNPWMLATVTKVEELKLILNLIPIWIATIPFGLCVAQGTTFFIKQSATLNRKISHNFVIPSASVFGLGAIGMIISVIVYEKILVPLLRRVTKNERGIKILQRIGIGMVFSILTMVVAALIEKKRLNLVRSDPINGSSSMSVFWLAPQLILIGIGDSFTLIGLQEYFYDQVPDSMRSLGIAFYLSVIGVGNFISSLLITLVDHISEKRGKSWFGKDLNSSRLDNFYWLLAAVTTANMGAYVILARRYSYKNVQGRGVVAVADYSEKLQEEIA